MVGAGHPCIPNLLGGVAASPGNADSMTVRLNLANLLEGIDHYHYHLLDTQAKQYDGVQAELHVVQSNFDEAGPSLEEREQELEDRIADLTKELATLKELRSPKSGSCARVFTTVRYSRKGN